MLITVCVYVCDGVYVPRKSPECALISLYCGFGPLCVGIKTNWGTNNAKLLCAWLCLYEYMCECACVCVCECSLSVRASVYEYHCLERAAKRFKCARIVYMLMPQLTTLRISNKGRSQSPDAQKSSKQKKKKERVIKQQADYLISSMRTRQLLLLPQTRLKSFAPSRSMRDSHVH